MDYMWNQHAGFGLIVNGPGSSTPPDYCFFGTFADEDYELCAEMCLQLEGCEAFALHLLGQSEWPSQCYGRGPGTTMVQRYNMVSGVKVCLGKMICKSFIIPFEYTHKDIYIYKE